MDIKDDKKRRLKNLLDLECGYVSNHILKLKFKDNISWNN